MAEARASVLNENESLKSRERNRRRDRPETSDRAPQSAPAPKAARDLSRRKGALPAENLPLILEVAPNDDYALIDSGDGLKLEQYGPYRIVRPEGAGALAAGARRRATGTRSTRSSPAIPTRKAWAAGAFRRKPLGETWPMKHDGVDFLGRFTSFRHVGVFPEQASHWSLDGRAGSRRRSGRSRC